MKGPLLPCNIWFYDSVYAESVQIKGDLKSKARPHFPLKNIQKMS